MTRFRYTKEHEDYIREIAPGRYNDEITEMFNRKFNTDKTDTAIRSLKKKLGVRSNVPTRRINPYGLFNQEQRKFIEGNVKGISNQDLTELVNETFGLNITARQMGTYKKNNKLSSGLTGHYKKGHETWNKGKKGLRLEGSEKGWFKKGHTPVNHKPVGSERICSKDGYTLVKIAEPNTWQVKQRVVWEEAFGPIPENHAILFGDRNKQNFDLNNLILVSRAQLAVLNQMDLIQYNAELTRIGITIADLQMKMRSRKQKEKKGVNSA